MYLQIYIVEKKSILFTIFTIEECYNLLILPFSFFSQQPGKGVLWRIYIALKLPSDTVASLLVRHS